MLSMAESSSMTKETRRATTKDARATTKEPALDARDVFLMDKINYVKAAFDGKEAFRRGDMVGAIEDFCVAVEGKFQEKVSKMTAMTPVAKQMSLSLSQDSLQKRNADRTSSLQIAGAVLASHCGGDATHGRPSVAPVAKTMPGGKKKLSLTPADGKIDSQLCQVAEKYYVSKVPVDDEKPEPSGLIGSVLDMLCLCLSKQGEWDSVCMYADLALQSGGIFEDMVNWRVRANLRVRRAIAHMNLAGGGADMTFTWQDELRQAGEDISKVERENKGRIPASSLRNLRFLNAQLSAQDGRATMQAPLSGLDRLRAMDP